MMDTGTLAGFPVLDVEVELFDGCFHAIDSSAIAFGISAKGAFRQLIPKRLLSCLYQSRKWMCSLLKIMLVTLSVT